MRMTFDTLSDMEPANHSGEADIVPTHLAKQRMERRLMLGVALLAATVLVATIVHGYIVLRPLPDMVTFAFRV